MKVIELKDKLIQYLHSEDYELFMQLSKSTNADSRSIVKKFLESKKEYKYFTDKEALEAVKEDGCALRFVKQQTEAICLRL